ncbi:MAG: GDP-L-fucose synthase family protein [Bdellovibrionales bacterium]
MDFDRRLFVSGHRGLLGRAVVEELRRAGYRNILTVSREELDLTSQGATEDFLKSTRPDAVIHCAALVGGIHANSSRPAEFLRDNVMIQTNVIHGSHLADVNTLVFFGSNCMYPVAAPQPMPEETLLQGPIEPSNLAYGAAKIAGMVQCQSYFKQYGRNYFTVIPASLYGPHDNFDLQSCHVTPGLLLRFHQAKTRGDPEFTVWGTGRPRRELLYVDDAAAGVRLLLERWEAAKGPVNLGAGEDISVREIAETIQKVVGYKGKLIFDTSKPDGNPRKLLDSARARALGFHPEMNLEEGLRRTYDWMLSGAAIRGVHAREM